MSRSCDLHHGRGIVQHPRNAEMEFPAKTKSKCNGSRVPRSEKVVLVHDVTLNYGEIKSWYEPAWRQRHRTKQRPSRAPNGPRILKITFSIGLVICPRTAHNPPPRARPPKRPKIPKRPPALGGFEAAARGSPGNRLARRRCARWPLSKLLDC